MKNKLAKLKYLPNKFEIIEPGDHVICAISKQKIYLQNLSYWNVELQEAYFSYKEAQLKRFFVFLEMLGQNLWLKMYL